MNTTTYARIHTQRTKSRPPSTLRARKKSHVPVVVAPKRRIIIARKRTRTHKTFNDGNPLQFKPPFKTVSLREKMRVQIQNFNPIKSFCCRRASQKKKTETMKTKKREKERERERERKRGRNIHSRSTIPRAYLYRNLSEEIPIQIEKRTLPY